MEHKFTLKVVHFQRKPVSTRYFSIENYFATVRAKFVPGVQVEVAICKYISQGLFRRIYNTLQATYYRADIYHITGDVHYLTLLLPKKKTLLTIHDCVFMQHPSPVARKILKLFWLTLPAKNAAYITCISEKTKEEVLRYISFAPERIVVIPTVVNETLFIADSKPFETSCPTILFIGTTPNKNLERVAKALDGLSCQLDIVGPLSEQQKACLDFHHISYKNEEGISNECMAEKYREADLLLFASIYEGFGMPILEAQLTGKAVITSDLSPMKEVSGDGACLVDPFIPESIRIGVEKVIREDAYREGLIKKGSLNADRFSSKKIAAAYVALYKKMHHDAI